MAAAFNIEQLRVVAREMSAIMHRAAERTKQVCVGFVTAVGLRDAEWGWRVSRTRASVCMCTDVCDRGQQRNHGWNRTGYS